ncbi:FAD-binding oxidoreductase [Nocardiopsis salina]|uniref:FAD-binding oxidoreductase n=1 Tax=Nocardiopsis salina TaxID=245836 RepID=UPI000364E2EA|nr:FAD-binding oxidoreductase [Nocardiopsis salina]
MSHVKGSSVNGYSSSGNDRGLTKVFEEHSRYPDVVRGTNQRWVGRPEYVCIVRSTAQVVEAVQTAVRNNKRISVRSGGHCYEDFVYRPDVDVVIDMSEMGRVEYDEQRRAFSVEPGSSLLNLYETLYRCWGVTLPGGMCHSVGAGGLIAGGGYGLLSRRSGLAADHLHAVEVVVVDDQGRARAVVATSDEADPGHDLWWAHTGGGGGNFGIVTKYWLRSPETSRAEPSGQLPRPPGEVLLSDVSWDWESMTEASFSRLLQNFGTWHERNSGPDSPYAGLCANLQLNHRSNGQIGLLTQVDASEPDAEQLLEEFLAAVNDGVGIETGAVTTPMGDQPPRPQLAAPRRLPWLQAAQMLGTGNPALVNPTLRAEYKSAYMRSAFPQDQISAIYRHLTRDDYKNSDALLLVISYGGRINTKSPHETATVHRDSVMKLLYENFWDDAHEDEYHLTWIREFYHDVYSRTGGVPQQNEVNDGCYVNYADADLNDPHWNTSDSAWSDLYYGANYQRLKEVKRRWDPVGVFQHRQSVEP